MTPHCKVWLTANGDGCVFGDGKWQLLLAIRNTGSLSAACEKLGMSYRKAWGELRKAEKRLGVALVEPHRGGQSRGGTTLTGVGEAWVAAYSRFRSHLEMSAATLFERDVTVPLGRMRPGS